MFFIAHCSRHSMRRLLARSIQKIESSHPADETSGEKSKNEATLIATSNHFFHFTRLSGYWKESGITS